VLRVLQLPRLSFPAAGHFRGGVLKHESCSISSLSRRSDRHNRCALHVSCLQTAPMKSAVKRGSSSHSRSPGLRVRLPSEKDALVTLRLRDGKLAKSHVGTLCKHSGLFASALQQGTEFEVEHCLLGRRFPVSFQIDLLLRCILIGSTYCCEHTNGKNRHRKPSFSTCLLHAMIACQAAAKWAAACTKLGCGRIASRPCLRNSAACREPERLSRRCHGSSCKVRRVPRDRWRRAPTAWTSAKKALT